MPNRTASEPLAKNRSHGTVCWESPSNIALVKYWGKHAGQLPMNPSISFVLHESVVRISIEYRIEPVTSFRIESFSLNGKANTAFLTRIEGYLRSLETHFPFLKKAHLKIDSYSSFPHSAGIASSAAAFSALALCLCSIEADFSDLSINDDDFYRRASFIARLGSGSAGRSVYNGLALWGLTDRIQGSSDEYAVRLDDTRVHQKFMTLRDAILIVDDSKKAVSSSQGHAMMHEHPFREARREQADRNLGKMLIALAGGNTKLFAEVVENEALTLHSLMMSSNPGYVLMKPNTITILEKIRNFRNENTVDACLTLDAGPNIHLLYFEKDKDIVKTFIQEELAPLCKNNRWIDDAIGNGPKQITNEP